MVHSYTISLQLRNMLHGGVTTQELHIQTDESELKLLLSLLDPNPGVLHITIHRALTMPALTKLQKLCREDLHIEAHELLKVS